MMHGQKNIKLEDFDVHIFIYIYL